MDLLGELLAMDPQRVHPQLHILSPEPGSSLAETAGAIAFDGFGPEMDEFTDDTLIRQHPEIFSVFFHYATSVPRWRTMLASVFLTHIVPSLGYPLTTHIVSNYFSGSLAVLFRAVAASEPGPMRHFDELVQTLWRRLTNVIHGLQQPYVEDALRFSRIMSTARKYAERENNPAWLVRFECDIQSLARTIVENPAGKLSESLLDRKERWRILRVDSAERLIIGDVPGVLATQLQPTLKPRRAPHVDRQLEELGLTAVDI